MTASVILITSVRIEAKCYPIMCTFCLWRNFFLCFPVPLRTGWRDNTSAHLHRSCIELRGVPGWFRTICCKDDHLRRYWWIHENNQWMLKVGRVSMFSVYSDHSTCFSL